MSAYAYLLRALLFSLVVVFLVVVFNYTVDPYGITGFRRISGFNEYKVDINEHARLMKKYQPLFHRHNTLVIGNSRVELGIRPSHRCFNREGMDVYNLGIPGAEVHTQLAYALNLVYQQPIKTLFLSLDFTDFISSNQQGDKASATLLQQPGGEFRYTASGELNPEYRRVVFLDYLKALFSLDALVASVKTVALQSAVAPDRDDSGFNPARDFEQAVDIEGPHALFDQKMSDLQKKYSRPWYLRDSGGQLHPEVGDVDAFLGVAADRGIKVYLFTNPFHEQFWDLFRTRGHMTVYQDWMQSLQEVVRKHAGEGIIFWDFSGDSAFIHETVPAAGVKSGPLRWFWEPAHYRQQLGDLMVDAMLSENCGTNVAFGQRIQ